jgi:hypothetical protein
MERFRYAIGAIILGITADVFGIEYAIYLIGILTIINNYKSENAKRHQKHRLYRSRNGEGTNWK